MVSAKELEKEFRIITKEIKEYCDKQRSHREWAHLLEEIAQDLSKKMGKGYSSKDVQAWLIVCKLIVKEEPQHPELIERNITKNPKGMLKRLTKGFQNYTLAYEAVYAFRKAIGKHMEELAIIPDKRAAHA